MQRGVGILQKIELLLESYERLTDYVSDDPKQHINFDFLDFDLYSCSKQQRGAELLESFPSEIPEQHLG